MRGRLAGLCVVLAGLPLASCGILPNAYSGCDKVRPYQSAKSVPPLSVPQGADLPDTRQAMKIPEVRTPALPDDGRCLDHPPSYGGSRPSRG